MNQLCQSEDLQLNQFYTNSFSQLCWTLPVPRILPWVAFLLQTTLFLEGHELSAQHREVVASSL